MISSSYPDLLSFNLRTRLATDLKARQDQVSQEVVTGRHADITARVDGRVGEVHLLNKAIADIEVENKVNDLASSRINLMSDTLTTVTEAVSGLDSEAIIALGTGLDSSIDTVVNKARGEISRVIDTLSVRLGTRNLFSGDASDQPTFAGTDQLISDVRNIMQTAGDSNAINAALDTYFNDPNGGFQTNIYTGGDNNMSDIRLGNGQKIAIDVKGDDQSIKDTLRGLAVLATADDAGFARDSADFAAIFEPAASSITNGINKLISLGGELGVYGGTFESIETRNNAERQTLRTALQNIVTRDQFEAAGELQQIQVQLETSYVLTSRLSQLSLVNFLR